MIRPGLAERLRQAETEIQALHEELAETNRGLAVLTLELEERVDERTAQLRATQEELEKTNLGLIQLTAELEDRVAERTSELQRANRSLRLEMAERQLAQEQLLEANLQLEQALDEVSLAQALIRRQERLRALGELASGIAHDFNNALGMIVGFAELLLVDPHALDDADEALAKVRLIHSAAIGAGAVVSRLREFYRPRSEQEPRHPVQLNDVIAQAISLTQPRWRDQAQIQGRDIRVETDFHSILTVDGIEADLREALANLILNAADAMVDGGTLTIRSRSTGDHVIVEVSDTGIGMPAEVRDRIFEPFFTTKGDGGTGLGLALVHGIIERHGGEIDVTSAEGQGTTFTIRLRAGSAAASGAMSPAEPSRYHGLRVLLAEDEPSLRRIMTSYLQIDGHQITATMDGRQALEAFRRDGADLVITDRAMPELNGDQLAAEVKRLAPATPVIMLTGLGDLMQELDERPAGVDLVVAKPVTLATFRAAVAQAMAGGTTSTDPGPC